MTLLFIILGYCIFILCLAGLLMWALDLDDPPAFLVNRVSREPVPPLPIRAEPDPWDGRERRTLQ